MSLTKEWWMFWRTTAEELPITEYRWALGEAMNIANLYRQGEFQMQTEKEKEDDLIADYMKAKREGKVNG
jgi:hypothetical protein